MAYWLPSKVWDYDVHWNYIKVKDWLQNLGIGEHTAVEHGVGEVNDETILHHDESAKDRWLLPLIYYYLEYLEFWWIIWS